MNKRQRKKRMKKLGYYWDKSSVIADNGGTIITPEDIKPVKWVRLE